jgi:hypothetical protein
VGSTGTPLPSGARVSRCVGSYLSVGRLASWSQSVARSGQSESDGFNPIHHHVVRGVWRRAITYLTCRWYLSRRALRRWAAGCPATRDIAVAAAESGLVHLSSPRLVRFGAPQRDYGRTAASHSHDRTANGLSRTGGASVAGRQGGEAGPIAADTRRLTEVKATALKARALFSLTPGPSQATHHARAANVPRSSTSL